MRTAQVNSIHHQAIQDVAPGFTVDAWSMPDGIAEAIYRQNRSKSYVAATQWHPEFEIAECPRSTAGLCWMIFGRLCLGQAAPGPQPQPLSDS